MVSDQVTVESGRTVTVYNLGDAYRLITAIHYNKERIYILRVLTQLGHRGLPAIPLNKVRRVGVRSTPDEEPRDLPETSWRVVDQGKAIALDGGFKAGLL